MSKNIIKQNSSKKVKSFEFESFTRVDRGLKEFSYSQFSDSKPDVSGDAGADKCTSEKMDSASAKTGLDEKTIYDKGFNDGYKKGFSEGEASSKKTYEAQKEDYLKVMKSGVEETVKQIQPLKKSIEELDEQLPDLVLGFVKEIVGFEALVNDKIVVSSVKNVIEKIRQYSDIAFIVNPEDLSIVKDMNTGYDVLSNSSVHKGDLKVKTNIGFIDFSLKTLFAQLKERLDEEFKSSKQS